MRLLLLFLIGCGTSSSEPTGTVDDEPEICKEHCVSDHPVSSFDDCCDSVTCYVDPATREWSVTYCDPAPPDPCAACTADQLCVQSFDGTCGGSARCVAKTVDCPSNACTPDCQAAYCAAPYQCEDRAPCGTEISGAFTCYGP